MAENRWSVTSNQQESGTPTINQSTGEITFPPNFTKQTLKYTVTYTSDNGCSSNPYEYSILPLCTKLSVSISQKKDSATYENNKLTIDSSNQDAIFSYTGCYTSIEPSADWLQVAQEGAASEKKFKVTAASCTERCSSSRKGKIKIFVGGSDPCKTIDVEQSAGVCNIKVKFNNTFVSNAQIKFVDSNGTQVGETRTISQTSKTEIPIEVSSADIEIENGLYLTCTADGWTSNCSTKKDEFKVSCDKSFTINFTKTAYVLGTLEITGGSPSNTYVMMRAGRFMVFENESRPDEPYGNEPYYPYEVDGITGMVYSNPWSTPTPLGINYYLKYQQVWDPGSGSHIANLTGEDANPTTVNINQPDTEETIARTYGLSRTIAGSSLEYTNKTKFTNGSVMYYIDGLTFYLKLERNYAVK